MGKERDLREHFERNRGNFVKEYSGPAKEIESHKGFNKLDKRAREQLRESAQDMTKTKSRGQVTVFRSKDGKERIVVKGNR